MTLARFKDLCIDAVDAASLGRFWGAVLGLDLHMGDDGNAHLTGATESHTVWINRVPEPKSVKHRVHLDVHGASVADLEALGATVVDRDSFPWAVMRDPEGGEFCLFVRDVVPDYRLYELGVDCVDHERTSRWWHALLGGSRGDERDFAYIEGVPNLPFDAICFASVPEPKTVKNRIHVDVTTADLDALVAAGATVRRRQDDEIRWNVMADPEGNEFCAFIAPVVG
jgi:hypothetical protein